MTSLIARGWIAELSAKLGRELPVTLPWHHPTIDKLASHLGGQVGLVASGR